MIPQQFYVIVRLRAGFGFVYTVEYLDRHELYFGSKAQVIGSTGPASSLRPTTYARESCITPSRRQKTCEIQDWQLEKGL